MRKLKLQMQVSVDGFVCGPNGEMDWMVWNWDDALKNYATEITDPVDTIVMGRNLAVGFIPYWEGVAADPNNPEQSAGIKFHETPKLVFSRTLDKTDPVAAAWKFTTITNGDLVQEINQLKKQPGKDIITYGGAGFAADLIKNNLIDEYHLFINPAAIGKGKTIFNTLEKNFDLKLAKSQAFECGIVLLSYTPSLK
jgi:dihydrofolate reductase